MASLENISSTKILHLTIKLKSNLTKRCCKTRTVEMDTPKRISITLDTAQNVTKPSHISFGKQEMTSIEHSINAPSQNHSECGVQLIKLSELRKKYLFVY